MEYQIDTRNHRTQEVRVGTADRDVPTFRKAGFLIQNLEGQVDGRDYQMKLAAPWNGFQYQLRQGDRLLASARRSRRMHAFEPDRPHHRHPLSEFDLDVSGRAMKLTPLDRHGVTFQLMEGDRECGRLTLRSFEAQQSGNWEADLSAPDDWSAVLAGWVAWLAREGRARMSSETA